MGVPPQDSVSESLDLAPQVVNLSVEISGLLLGEPNRVFLGRYLEVQRTLGEVVLDFFIVPGVLSPEFLAAPSHIGYLDLARLAVCFFFLSSSSSPIEEGSIVVVVAVVVVVVVVVHLIIIDK
jgi:hypothetical protein